MAKSRTEKTEITIPLALAKLLVAGPDDYKDANKYEHGQETAKALLKVLLAANK